MPWNSTFSHFIIGINGADGLTYLISANWIFWFIYSVSIIISSHSDIENVFLLLLLLLNQTFVSVFRTSLSMHFLFFFDAKNDVLVIWMNKNKFLIDNKLVFEWADCKIMTNVHSKSNMHRMKQLELYIYLCCNSETFGFLRDWIKSMANRDHSNAFSRTKESAKEFDFCWPQNTLNTHSAPFSPLVCIRIWIEWKIVSNIYIKKIKKENSMWRIKMQDVAAYVFVLLKIIHPVYNRVLDITPDGNRIVAKLLDIRLLEVWNRREKKQHSWQQQWMQQNNGNKRRQQVKKNQMNIK